MKTNNKLAIITTLLIAVPLALLWWAGLTSAQEIIKDKIFIPELTETKTEKATTTLTYSFGIKTIKEHPRHTIQEVSTSTEIIPAYYEDNGTTTVLVATSTKIVETYTDKVIPYEIKYATSTFSKTITADEWNYCRASKTKKECQIEVDQAVADSQSYHLDVEKMRYKQMQDRLNRTNYFDEIL